MEKEKKELLKAEINNYEKLDKFENPILCVEAIGFLKACKIVIPEDVGLLDELIAEYSLLGLLIALGE